MNTYQLPAALESARKICRNEMLSHPQFRMSFRSRRKMLLEIGPTTTDKILGRELTPSKFCRIHLMLSVARKVAPTWLEAYSNPSVDTLLTCIEQYLQGKESLDMVYAKTDSLQGELQNGPDGRDDAWLAGSAASCCGWVCFRDEILIPDDWITWDDVYEPDDPDLWDGAFYAAGSYAKGMPWMDQFDKEKYHEFWLWYLDLALAAAWQAAKERFPSLNGSKK